MLKFSRARQQSAESLGVLPWQQEFWLLVVEHALAKRSGPPELSKLEGFNAPAVTQYTVTTPDLLRSFRKYNAGKPYYRQVRPFGFMVMFQQIDEVDPSTIMRVIAPFNRNPAKAARKAFDRDTGVAVRPKQLKTYAASLRTYYNHPEAKFLNGERGDRGPTLRRHVIARSIVHIGKEANKLDPQSAMGVDPTAQAEFHVDTSRATRLKVIEIAARQFGPARIAREAGLSRKHISGIAGSGAAVTEATLSKIERAISGLEIAEKKRSKESADLLDCLRTECKQGGLRQAADKLGVCPGVLSRVVAGQRHLSEALARRIKESFLL
jgi:hypothetical protein